MADATMGSANIELPDAVDVLVVGGGVMGLGTAYHLAKTSNLQVAVLERSYLVSGASGRNGGGIRMQWGDEGNVALMMESIDICRGLAQDLGINLWFRQGGYLFLGRTADDEARLSRNAEVHRGVGAPTRLIGPDEVRKMVPELDTTGVRMASFNPDDGVVFPWPFVWGYAAQAASMGVTIRTHTGVSRLDPAGSGFQAHLSTGESIRAKTVINATGAWSNELNASLGVRFPNHPHRHEILSSEPLKPFLDPLVVDLSNGLYFSQSTRGEIVTGMTVPDPPGYEESGKVELGSSMRFLAHIGRAMTRVLPLAARVKILRQWAGPYDVSPDGDAIVGPTPDHPNLIQACGFTGHGFMMAPAVGRLLAAYVADGTAHPMLQRWDPGRFQGGATVRREDMVIG